MKQKTVGLILMLLVVSSRGWAGDITRKYDQPMDTVYQTALPLARAQNYIIVAASPEEYTITFRTKPGAWNQGIDFILSLEKTPVGNTIVSLRFSKYPLISKGGAKAKQFLELLDQQLRRSDIKEREVHPASEGKPQTIGPGTVNVTSNPDGAEIYVDGAFVGNPPASLKLTQGTHKLRISRSGFKDWNREIIVQAGSDLSIKANLEMQD